MPIDSRLTAPVVIPYAPAGRMTNDDLAALAEARGTALREVNARLAEIRRLQPRR